MEAMAHLYPLSSIVLLIEHDDFPVHKLLDSSSWSIIVVVFTLHQFAMTFGKTLCLASLFPTTQKILKLGSKSDGGFKMLKQNHSKLDS